MGGFGLSIKVQGSRGIKKIGKHWIRASSRENNTQLCISFNIPELRKIELYIEFIIIVLFCEA
jgi:hypothetical protein